MTTQKFDGKGNYYATESTMIKKLKDAVDEVVRVHGAEFCAKVIVYVRSEDGHRTSTHIAAAHLAPKLSGEEFGKFFFSKRARKQKKGGVIFRLDDMMEILACYMIPRAVKAGQAPENYKKWFKNIPIPHSIKKGFKSALEQADWYELAKYQNKTKVIALNDLLNIFRPNPNKSRAWTRMDLNDYIGHMESNKSKGKNKKNAHIIESIEKARVFAANNEGKVRVHAFEASRFGFLYQTNTSEDKNSKLGQDIKKKVDAGIVTQKEAEVLKVQGKASNYKELVGTNRLGYNALIKQLRQIAEVCVATQDHDLVRKTCAMIEDIKLVKSSLIWPYELEQAHLIMEEVGSNVCHIFAKSIVKVYDVACENLQDLGFFGKTAVIVDTSDSMKRRYRSNKPPTDRQGNIKPGYKNERSPLQLASLISGTLAKGTNARLYHFANYTQEIKYSASSTAFDIADNVMRHRGKVGHGTETDTIFKRGGVDACDRMFIISDMCPTSGWSGFNDKTIANYLNDWRKRTGMYNCKVYLINVNSYGQTVIPSKSDGSVMNMAGYSFETLKIAVKSETNPDELYDTIHTIELNNGRW